MSQADGGRILNASWISNAVFALASMPAILGLSSGSEVGAVVSLVLFAASLVVWVWAFAIAAARSSQGDAIAVGSLFLVEGTIPGAAKKSLYWSFVASLVITAVAAVSNPFAVLVPMLSLGFVGLWGARHAEFPRRRDVEIEDRPLRPVRSTRQRGGIERRPDGRARP